MNVVDEWFHASMEGALPEMLLDPASLMFDLLDPAAVRRLVRRSSLRPTGQPQVAVQPRDGGAVVAGAPAGPTRAGACPLKPLKPLDCKRTIDLMIMTLQDSHAPRIFSKDTLHKGQPAQIECVDIFGQIYTLTRGPVTVLALEDEWYEDVRDPAAVSPVPP